MREYRRWEEKHGFNDTGRKKEYVRMKECHGRVFQMAVLVLMVRGGCLPVGGSGRMT